MKVNAKRLAKSQAFLNVFYRSSLIEKIWKKYHNCVENLHCSTTINVFSFFFLLLNWFFKSGIASNRAV